MKMFKKAQGGLAAALISILIGIIIGVGVTIPIITQVIANSSLTGMTAMVVTYIPVMIGVVLFVSVAALVMGGRR